MFSRLIGLLKVAFTYVLYAKRRLRESRQYSSHVIISISGVLWHKLNCIWSDRRHDEKLSGTAANGLVDLPRPPVTQALQEQQILGYRFGQEDSPVRGRLGSVTSNN
jgi:hypothetical protein